METKNNKKTIAIVGIVLALAVALIAGVLVIQATPANKLKRQIKLAEKYLTEMNYEQALIAYSEAIKIDPKCEQAYLAMADIYIKQGEAEKAVAILEEGQKNIQTDSMTEKLEEVKKKATSANQSQKQSTVQATEAATESPKKSGIKAVNAGEYITFGSYEQDNDTSNGAEPIEWLVLDNQGDKMLVISKFGLDCQPYNTTLTDVTWETCTLRNWLNTEFYNTAFNNSEKASVITTTIENPNNASYGTKGGNATSDNVFCLSIDEVNRYFTSGEARATKPTEYAVSRGAYAITSTNWYAGNCWWWLRSPGNYQYFAAFVFDDGRVVFGGVDYPGVVIDGGYIVGDVSSAVRPAMWIVVNP